jgi:Icc-related predicted phosphoesterase
LKELREYTVNVVTDEVNDDIFDVFVLLENATFSLDGDTKNYEGYPALLD